MAGFDDVGFSRRRVRQVRPHQSRESVGPARRRGKDPNDARNRGIRSDRSGPKIVKEAQAQRGKFDALDAMPSVHAHEQKLTIPACGQGARVGPNHKTRRHRPRQRVERDKFRVWGLRLGRHGGIKARPDRVSDQCACGQGHLDQ